MIHAKIYHGWSAKINVMVKPDWLWLHQCNNDFTCANLPHFFGMLTKLTDFTSIPVS